MTLGAAVVVPRVMGGGTHGGPGGYPVVQFYEHFSEFGTNPLGFFWHSKQWFYDSFDLNPLFLVPKES